MSEDMIKCIYCNDTIKTGSTVRIINNGNELTYAHPLCKPIGDNDE